MDDYYTEFYGILTERYNANGLEHTIVDYQGAPDGPLHLGRNSWALCDDSDDDDEHAEKGERTGFCKLDDC